MVYVNHLGAFKSKYPVIVYLTSFGTGVSSCKINVTQNGCGSQVFNDIVAQWNTKRSRCLHPGSITSCNKYVAYQWQWMHSRYTGEECSFMSSSIFPHQAGLAKSQQVPASGIFVMPDWPIQTLFPLMLEVIIVRLNENLPVRSLIFIL